MKYILMAFLLLSTILEASNFGVILKLEGKAKVQHDKSFKKSKAILNMPIMAGDTIMTYKKSKVVIELKDKTKIVLDEYATLKLISNSEYEQNGGKIFFKVTKRKGKKGLKVRTPFAIIGVKGTEFVVTDENNSQALSLNEGLVGVDSPDGKDFELIDEDKAKAKMVNTPADESAEFEAYKAELYKEFAEYTASFDLKPGKKLRFNNGRVLQSSHTQAEKQVFKLYMSDAEFNAISDELEEDVTFDSKGAEDSFDGDFFSDEL